MSEEAKFMKKMCKIYRRNPEAMVDAYKHNLAVSLEKVADALEGLVRWL